MAQLAAYEDEIFRTAGIVFGMTLLVSWDTEGLGGEIWESVCVVGS